ncbi:hypothetical protein [Klebsiella pneumoniae]|uniref:hypothetical protein n=1 Tax=Klebsiella pneumoniae TaxID=573 RepID=UPI0015EA8007|nr:hypothetical protein [Klebsiella pneumoniae]QLW68788.1 hypothetical protein HV282_06545 [Klebsiella pneumoniae]
MTTDITELAQRVEHIISDMKLKHGDKDTYAPVMKWDEFLALVEALEKAQQRIAELENYAEAEAVGADKAAENSVYWMKCCKELESRTVKLPDGWQFEECEIEGCENGAIFSVGTGSRNIHLCDKCAHEPQNSRLKKSPLSKRLPFKMSAGIKVEAE